MRRSVDLGQELSRKARHAIGPLMGAAMMAYFGYHAVQGDRGLIAWWNLRYELEQTEGDLARVSAEKRALENRVALMRPQSLDRDILEERARIMLGVVRADDLIIPVIAPTLPAESGK